MHICSHSNKCLIPHPHTYSRVARLTVSVAHDDDDDDCKRDASSKVCSLAWMCRIVVLHCRHRLNYKLLLNRFFTEKKRKGSNSSRRVKREQESAAIPFFHLFFHQFFSFLEVRRKQGIHTLAHTHTYRFIAVKLWCEQQQSKQCSLFFSLVFCDIIIFSWWEKRDCVCSLKRGRILIRHSILKKQTLGIQCL